MLNDRTAEFAENRRARKSNEQSIFAPFWQKMSATFKVADIWLWGSFGLKLARDSKWFAGEGKTNRILK
jgi:hypothetical protein